MSFRKRYVGLFMILSLAACLCNSVYIAMLTQTSLAYATAYSYSVTNPSEIEWCNELGIGASDCGSQTIQQKVHDLQQFRTVECTKLGLNPLDCTDININQRVDELAEFRAYEQTQYYYSLLTSPAFIILYIGTSLGGLFLWRYLLGRRKSKESRNTKDVGRTQ